MKKTITLFAAIALCTGSLFAQSIVFLQNGEQLENNAEITVTETTLDPYMGIKMESGLKLKNTTNNSIGATLTQTIIGETGQTAGYGLEVCWGLNCYPKSNKDESWTNSVAAGIDGRSHFDFWAQEGAYANFQVKYEVYPTSNSSNKSTVTINYNYGGSSIGNVNISGVSVYNQNGKTCFKLNRLSPATQIVVYNITGQAVGQYTPSSHTYVLPITLTKGIYIYTVKENGKMVSSGKHVVR